MKPGFAFLLELMEDVGGFVEDVVVVRGEFDVVRQQDFDMVGAESFQRRFNALARSCRREVELGHVEAARLGADVDFVAPAAFESFAEELFRQTLSVKRGGIDEIHPCIDRGVNAVGGFGRGHGTELLSERSPALSEDGDIQAGLAEWSVFHGRGQRGFALFEDSMTSAFLCRSLHFFNRCPRLAVVLLNNPVGIGLYEGQF